MEHRTKQNFIDAAYEAWSKGDPKPLVGFATREVGNLTPKEIAGILSLAVHINSDQIDVNNPLLERNEITEYIETILTPPNLLNL